MRSIVVAGYVYVMGTLSITCALSGYGYAVYMALKALGLV